MSLGVYFLCFQHVPFNVNKYTHELPAIPVLNTMSNIPSRFAGDTLNERFQPDAEPRRDMIAQFLRYGATREEATGEALVQV